MHTMVAVQDFDHDNDEIEVGAQAILGERVYMDVSETGNFRFFTFTYAGKMTEDSVADFVDRMSRVIATHIDYPALWNTIETHTRIVITEYPYMSEQDEYTPCGIEWSDSDNLDLVAIRRAETL